MLLKAQAEVRLVASYTPDALTEYLRDRAKFDWRGCTLSTPPHVAGAQTETEAHFDQVLFVLLASNLLSVEALHVARAIMYIKSTLSTKLAKKFHELWVIEEQRDQATHGYLLLLTVQAFLTTYVLPTMKDDQLKAMVGLHWMTKVAATKAAELFAQCTKTARAMEGLSIEQKFRQLTLVEQNEMVLAIAPSWARTAQRKATADEPAFSTWQGFFALWNQLRTGLD